MTTLSSHPIFKTIIENDKYFNAHFDLDEDRLNAALSEITTTIKGTVAYPSKPVTGTLTSRVRSLLSECVPGLGKEEFQRLAELHPAYDKIVSEFVNVSDDWVALNVLFDRLEAINVLVFFDRVTKRVSLGLDPVIMGSGIREYTPMQDIKNKNHIDRANGKSVIYGHLQFEEEEIHEIDSLNRTFYVSFNI